MSYTDDSTFLLAIDPGANGGWVYKGGATVFCGKNSELPQLTINHKTVIIVEKVPAFVGPIPASASFKLGYSYGWLVGLHQGRGHKVVLVTPQTWQKFLGIGTKGEQTTTQWKNKLKDEAIKLFPDQKRITLATADAYLLLHYALKNKLS